MTFLDIQGAYDNVNQKILWTELKELGLNMKLVKFLQEVYMNNTVTITWEAETTQPAAIRQGLRQGCPLSRLEQSELNFNVSYMERETTMRQKLPCLMNADDILLLADNRDELQKSVGIRGEEEYVLGFRFSGTKPEVMLVNNIKRDPLKIQSMEMRRRKLY